METHSPSPKSGRTPQIFGPCLLWPSGWMDQDSTWHGGRPWSSPHSARWGHSSPPQKRKQSPQFSAHLYCGQTAGYTKMPLSMEVGLSPGDFVLDGDAVPFPQKGAESPSLIFGSFLLWPNGCMYQNATWYGARPRPRRLCVRWGPVAPSPKGGGPPKFSAHVYCDQTAGWMKLILSMAVSYTHLTLPTNREV